MQRLCYWSRCMFSSCHWFVCVGNACVLYARRRAQGWPPHPPRHGPDDVWSWPQSHIDQSGRYVWSSVTKSAASQQTSQAVMPRQEVFVWVGRFHAEINIADEWCMLSPIFLSSRIIIIKHFYSLYLLPFYQISVISGTRWMNKFSFTTLPSTTLGYLDG